MPTMPNLIGLQYQNALAAMVAAGVRVLPLGYFQTDPVTLSWLTAGAVGSGTVLAQVPPSGTSIGPNAPVILTVSGFPVAVEGDFPVLAPQIDSVFDGPGSAFILDVSTLQ